jgi:hypothetical protein
MKALSLFGAESGSQGQFAEIELNDFQINPEDSKAETEDDKNRIVQYFQIPLLV